MYENPTDFGKWNEIGATNGGSVTFNSSHVYPLTVDDYVLNVKKMVSNHDTQPIFIELRPTNKC